MGSWLVGGVSSGVVSWVGGSVPVVPDAETAREWAVRELADPVYHEGPSLLERFLEWVMSLFANAPTGLGLPPADSAMVSVSGLPEDAAERLAAAGVMAAGRGGGLRLSCHLYTTDADVDRALEALKR